MRTLVISDIHSNLQALEAVLAAAPSYDQVWNLGDVVGYGANPNEVLDRVRQLGGLTVRGNHDRGCSGLADLDDFSEHAATAVRWTAAVVTENNREWLRQLPRGPVVTTTADACCVHGSPLDEDEYLLFSKDALASIDASPTRITFFGHTHVQGGFATNGEDNFRLVPQYASSADHEQYELPLRTGARYLLNPGSVGQPRDGDWRAAFAMYDDAQALLTWHRVPYDVHEAQRRIRTAGLPDFLASRLQTGE